MTRNAVLIVVVAALGYFVDIYDLLLFNVVKKESLIEIMPQASPEEIKKTGIFLFNMQMTGMLLGGILWGIWGDKRGRISVLFGSILLYSIANVVNAFVTSVPVYALVRIIAGIGLAGELGAGITLVSETLSKERRGIGTMIIVTFGALGAVVAGIVGTEGRVIGAWLETFIPYSFPNWKVAYLIGGTMGLLLLLMRVGLLESGMFAGIRHQEVKKGDFLMLFRDGARFRKYLSCILIGVPIWYTIGLLVANSEEIFSREMGVTGKVINGRAVMFCYIGLSAGDFISGLLSQFLRSRKKVVILYLCFTTLLSTWFLFFSRGISPESYYFLSFLIGVAAGYWAIFVTIASEQFGTNIRSTVTNTVPNFVRGSVPLITGLFGFLNSFWGNTLSAAVVGVICLALSFWSIFQLKDSFDKDLNYLEQG